MQSFQNIFEGLRQAATRWERITNYVLLALSYVLCLLAPWLAGKL